MLPLFDDNPHQRPPVVCLLLILANLAVMVIEVRLPSSGAVEAFFETWGLVPANMRLGAASEVWLTPFSSMFLHGGWMHCAGNCWFLWIFGNNIEDKLGHLGFLAFYLASGLCAGIMQFAFDPTSQVPMVGASGAISGVLGAYLRMFPKAPVYTLVPVVWAPILPIPAFVFFLVWFGFQFWQGVGAVFSTDMTGGVAWWAHIGGFAAGLVLGRAKDRKPRKDPRGSRRR